MRIAKRNIKGNARWILDTGEEGGRKRERITFRSRIEADTALAALKAETGQIGDDWLHLTEAERLDACRAIVVARRKGVTLTEALRVYEHSAKNSPLLSEALASFLSTKASGYRPAYIAHLTAILAGFARGRESVRLADVTTADLREFLDPAKYQPATLHGMRRRLATFFAWCLTQELLERDPIAKLDQVRVAPVAPKILSVDESERLMHTAQAQEPGLVRFLALALFLGIRPEEIRRLKPEDIKVERGFVEVGADASKVGRRRLVTIPDNAQAWLKLGGPLVPVGFWKRMGRLRLAARVPWSCDILRHTAASMMLARDRDAARVALELGNSPEILFRHYRELVTKEDAERFWAIRPA